MISRNTFIIPLRKNRVDKGLIVILAFMVCMALLFIGSAVMVSDFLQSWSKGVQNTVSVSALYPSDMDTQTQQKITDSINHILTNTQGIKIAQMLSDTEKQQLLSHWLGDKIDKNTLSYPAMWDITVKDNFDISALQHQIKNIYTDANIDNYMQWKNPILSFASDMIWGASILSVLAIGVLVLIISVCMRTIVSLHLDTIQVLTLLGASDTFIIKDVGRYAFWVGFKSAVLGVVLSIIVFIGVKFWYMDMPISDIFTLTYVYENMLQIIGLCAIIPTIASISRMGACRSARHLIQQQYRI